MISVELNSDLTACSPLIMIKADCFRDDVTYLHHGNFSEVQLFLLQLDLYNYLLEMVLCYVELSWGNFAVDSNIDEVRLAFLTAHVHQSHLQRIDGLFFVKFVDIELAPVAQTCCSLLDAKEEVVTMLDFSSFVCFVSNHCRLCQDQVL